MICGGRRAVTAAMAGSARSAFPPGGGSLGRFAGEDRSDISGGNAA
jgi:hypothetical protein